MVCMTPT